MKNYEKPSILENKYTKYESVYAASGSAEETPTCSKTFNRYSADWTCQGKCQYYVTVPGWSWLNDECALA